VTEDFREMYPNKEENYWLRAAVGVSSLFPSGTTGGLKRGMPKANQNKGNRRQNSNSGL